MLLPHADCGYITLYTALITALTTCITVSAAVLSVHIQAAS